MLAFLAAAFAPPHCLACEVPVAAGARVCSDCRAAVPWLALASGGPPPAVWSPVAFDGPARALVHALKFGGRIAAADVMAAQIAANAPPGLLDCDALVPAPADPLRARLRGFDHAHVLARRLGERTGVPVRPVLVRRAGARQVGAARAQRLGRDLGIGVRSGIGIGVGRRAGFGVRREFGGRLVVIDDVQTTGATLRACAHVLREAGADAVRGVAYARTLG